MPRIRSLKENKRNKTSENNDITYLSNVTTEEDQIQKSPER